jgi:hypothetical protein
MLCRRVFLVAVLCSAPVSAADLHVSPTGNDGQPGTREKPLAAARDAVRNEAGRAAGEAGDGARECGDVLLAAGGRVHSGRFGNERRARWPVEHKVRPVKLPEAAKSTAVKPKPVAKR